MIINVMVQIGKIIPGKGFVNPHKGSFQGPMPSQFDTEH